MNNVTIMKLLIFCAITYASACNTKYGVDLSHLQQQNGAIVQNNVTFTSEFIHFENGSTIGCVCDIKSCVRKCCPHGQFLKDSKCAKTSANWSIDGDFYIVIGDKCSKPNQLRSVLFANEFVIESNGQLFFNSTSSGGNDFSMEQYCVDYIGDEDGLKALVCVSSETVERSPNVTGMIISMPFLLLTFIIYALLPERNRHAKSLMCYVLALFWAYLLLVFIQVNIADLTNDTSCKTTGVFCLFFFMVSFVWMNVMSIDIYWTFSGNRGFAGAVVQSEKKRFLFYNVYALGLPFIISGIVAYLISDPSIPEDAWYHPGIGKGQCWFTPGCPSLLYFYGPLSILITVNIVLFLITAWKIIQIQRATAILRRNNIAGRRHTKGEADRNEFYLYLKLMLAMGINWSLEIVSWAINWQVGAVPPAVWYVTDFCNAIYGVFIFLIFVFKRSIWNMVKQRFDQLRGKFKFSGNSPSTTESSMSEKGNNIPGPHENNKQVVTVL